MTPHFGPSVTGHEAFDKAVRSEQGGGNVFGTRVRDSIPDSGPTNTAKRVSEFGVNVLEDAHASNEKGEPGDTVSIDSLRNILAENPTFFDSLYEAELARDDGARPDALAIFYEVERGIKGQMRADVMQEIRSLMGQKGVDAEARANLGQVRVQQQKEMAQRTEENALLADAPRIKELRDRADNLKAIRDAQESGVATQVGFTTEAQERRIADEQGIQLPAQDQGIVGTVPAKPEGDTNVETQSAGNRLGVPKGTSGTEGEGSSASGSSPATGAASGSTSSEGKTADETGTGEGTVEPDDFTKGELADMLGDEFIGNVKGSGANDAVLKEDIVKAAKKGLKNGSLVVRAGKIVPAT